MKSLAKYFPGQRLTMIQCLATLLIVVIICCVSFGTIFSLTVSEDGETTEAIEDIINTLGGDAQTVEIPEKVDVNVIFLFKSFGAGIDAVASMISTVSDATEDENSLNQDKIEETRDKLLNQDTVNLACLIAAVVQSFSTGIVFGICNIFLILLAFIFPIVLLVSSIIGIIGFLCNFRTDWGKAFHKVSKVVSTAIELFVALLLILLLVPEVQFGSAVYTVLWLCVATLILNFLVSRIKFYEPAEFKYLNILQIVSVVSLGGFLLFFFNFKDSNAINALWDGMSKVDLTPSFENFTKILPVALFIGFIIGGLMNILTMMTESATRFACMSKSKSDTRIRYTVLGLATIAAFLVMPKVTEIEIDLGEGANAFWMAAAGVVVMFVCEILIKVLPKKICPEVTVETRRNIVTGAYSYTAPVDEAPVDEAPVDEAPAEEAPAEEAPAEEAPAEEAPVEEAPVEEAPAEETSAT